MVISDRGKQTLNENLSEINVQYLNKFQEFIDFRLAKGENEEPTTINNDETKKQTPEESIEYGYKGIRKSLE